MKTVTLKLNISELKQISMLSEPKPVSASQGPQFGYLNSKLVLTLALAGGVDATPLEIFCDARRTMKRIVLKFCIAYGASVAQLLKKKI